MSEQAFHQFDGDHAPRFDVPCLDDFSETAGSNRADELVVIREAIPNGVSLYATLSLVSLLLLLHVVYFIFTNYKLKGGFF